MNEQTFINLVSTIDCEINQLTMSNLSLVVMAENQSKLEKLIEARGTQLHLAKELIGLANV